MSSPTDRKTTDYVGNIIYEAEKIGTTAATSKTRILIDGGYIEGGVYYFFLTDHLGNNRVVAKADGTVIQRNHYYPFGMVFGETPLAEQKAQPYKYNGKEFDSMHGLNWSDYEARWKAEWYVPTMDPHAEGYYSTSPYAYVMNNPLKYIDPTGMDTVLVTAEGKIEDIFPGGEDITYHSSNAVIVTPQENSESVTAIRSSFYPPIISSMQSGRIDGLGINSPEFIALTFGRSLSLSVARSAASLTVQGGAKLLTSGGAKLTQKSLEHIIKRHWFTSGAKQAGKFASNTTGKSLKQMIEKATTQGVFKANTKGRAGTIAEFTFDHIIGTTSSGLSSSSIRVVINTSGEVITAFPI